MTMDVRAVIEKTIKAMESDVAKYRSKLQELNKEGLKNKKLEEDICSKNGGIIAYVSFLNFLDEHAIVLKNVSEIEKEYIHRSKVDGIANLIAKDICGLQESRELGGKLGKIDLNKMEEIINKKKLEVDPFSQGFVVTDEYDAWIQGGIDFGLAIALKYLKGILEIF